MDFEKLDFGKKLQKLLQEESDENPVIDEDSILIKMAEAFIIENYEPGFHQLGSAAYGMIPGSLYYGLQLDAKIGQNSWCAEGDAILDAWKKAKDMLRTIVTIRGRRPGEGGGTHIVPPCERCRENLSQFAPMVRVIILGDDGPIKLPIKTLLGAYKYAQRIRSRRPGEEELEKILLEWGKSQRFEGSPEGLTYEKFVAQFLKKGD